MDFLLETTKIWQKSRDFWFADFFLEILKMDFPMDFGCFLAMYCLKFILILNLANPVLSKTTFGSIIVSSDGVLCTKEILWI
jgi:hypothetical protein